MTTRSNALAERLEQGATALAETGRSLTTAEWRTPLPKDGRTIGVVFHHVASIYPLEIELAQTLAAGKPIEGVTWADVHKLNAEHAKENSGVTKETSLRLLAENQAS